jgi:hypothetical protein
VVSLTDLKMEGGGEEADGVPRGAIFSLASAFFYATYLVFLRKRVDHEDKLDIPLFFGTFELDCRLISSADCIDECELPNLT